MRKSAVTAFALLALALLDSSYGSLKTIANATTLVPFKLWEDESFLTHLIVDKNAVFRDDKLGKCAFEEQLQSSTIDAIMKRIPELYFLRCKEINPKCNVDLYEECEYEFEASPHLQDFVAMLRADDLKKSVLLPPGELRSLMIQRLESLQLADSFPIFATFRTFKYRFGPYLKTLARDIRPLVKGIMQRMPENEFEQLRNHLSQLLIDARGQPKSFKLVEKSCEARIIPALVLEEIENRHDVVGEQFLWHVLLYATVFALPTDIEHALSEWTVKTANHNPEENKRYLKSIIDYNPLLVVESQLSVDSLFPVEEDLKNVLEWTLHSLIENHIRVMWKSANILRKIERFITTIPFEEYRQLYSSLLGTFSEEVYERPKWGPLKIEGSEFENIPQEVLRNDIRPPTTLCKSTYLSPLLSGPLNPTVFVAIIGAGGTDSFGDAFLGVHPYLSEIDQKYLRAVPGMIRGHSSGSIAAENTYKYFKCLANQDASTLFGNNRVGADFVKRKYLPPDSRQLAIMSSLLFEIGPFGPETDSGLKRLFMAICRAHFREAMIKLELAKASLPKNYTIVDMFAQKAIPKPWLIEYYGCLECADDNRRALMRFLADENIMYSVLDWIISLQDSTTISSCRQRFAKLLRKAVDSKIDLVQIALAIISMTIELVHEATSLEDNISLASRPAWYVYFVKESTLPKLAADNFELVFPLLNYEEQVCCFVEKSAIGLLNEDQIELIVENVQDRPAWFVEQLLERTFTRENEKTPHIQNVFEIHTEFRRCGNVHYTDRKMSIILKALKRMEESGPIDCPFLHGKPLDLARIPVFYTSDVPQIYLNTLVAHGCFNPAPTIRQRILLKTMFYGIVLNTGDVKGVIDFVCSKTSDDSRAHLEAFIASEPPRLCAPFWDRIQERSTFAESISLGAIFLRMHLKNRTVVVKVPSEATFADLYHILRANFAYPKVFAITAVDSATVYLPDDQSIRFTPTKEFKMLKSSAANLWAVSQVFQDFGLNMDPRNAKA